MKNQRQAFWTAIILHAVVLLALVIAALVQAFRPKEKIHVFEMVEPPSSSPAAAATAAEPLPLPEIPDIQPMDIPDPVVPQPAPAPKPAPQPTPKPAPKPAPPKPQERMSYEEFIKQNPIRDPKPVTQPTRKPIEVPKIQTQQVQANLRNLLASQADYERVSNMTAEEQTALQRYGAQLNARLNRAWIKPENLSGIQLVAQVTFDVSSSGVISNVRLNPSSGNSAFDNSVLAAFRKVGSAGPTPTRQSHSFTMRFKMVEQ